MYLLFLLLFHDRNRLHVQIQNPYVFLEVFRIGLCHGLSWLLSKPSTWKKKIYGISGNNWGLHVEFHDIIWRSRTCCMSSDILTVNTSGTAYEHNHPCTCRCPSTWWRQAMDRNSIYGMYKSFWSKALWSSVISNNASKIKIHFNLYVPVPYIHGTPIWP